MPLIKRIVEPIHVSNVGVHPAVRNELECVANNTLANTIRQLSSLSKHAEDMFTELFTEASSVYNRLNQLQSRMEDVHRKVKQLDATVEEGNSDILTCVLFNIYLFFDILVFKWLIVNLYFFSFFTFFFYFLFLLGIFSNIPSPTSNLKIIGTCF